MSKLQPIKTYLEVGSVQPDSYGKNSVSSITPRRMFYLMQDGVSVFVVDLDFAFNGTDTKSVDMSMYVQWLYESQEMAYIDSPLVLTLDKARKYGYSTKKPKRGRGRKDRSRPRQEVMVDKPFCMLSNEAVWNKFMYVMAREDVRFESFYQVLSVRGQSRTDCGTAAHIARIDARFTLMQPGNQFEGWNDEDDVEDESPLPSLGAAMRASRTVTSPASQASEGLRVAFSRPLKIKDSVRGRREAEEKADDDDVVSEAASTGPDGSAESPPPDDEGDDDDLTIDSPLVQMLVARTGGSAELALSVLRETNGSIDEALWYYETEGAPDGGGAGSASQSGSTSAPPLPEGVSKVPTAGPASGRVAGSAVPTAPAQTGGAGGAEAPPLTYVTIDGNAVNMSGIIFG